MVVMYFYLQDLADNPRRVELRRAFTTGARRQPSHAAALSARCRYFAGEPTRCDPPD